ncbi:MAG: transposase [Rickettsia endosymbiont of Pentastiridius leporinus]
MKSGCQWRLLPKEFPAWQTVYDYYLRWCKNGKWQEIHDSLVNKVREKASRKPTPTVCVIDSQSVKTRRKWCLEDMMPARKLRVENAI